MKLITIHHQDAVYCICSVRYSSFIYVDSPLARSGKMIIEINLKKKYILLVVITQIYHGARSTECHKKNDRRIVAV